MNNKNIQKLLVSMQGEMPFWIGMITSFLFYFYGMQWFADLSNISWYLFLFAWLFLMMLWLAFGATRHERVLGEMLGEPYGTLILTMSIVIIEVIMISAIMITGVDNPTLARDTIYSILMIMTGMIGLNLLIGAIKYREQTVNIRGASIYLGIIIPLIGLGIILPRYMPAAPGGEVSTLMAIYLLVVSVGLYTVFLIVQTIRHSSYFRLEETADKRPDNVTDIQSSERRGVIGYHLVFLLLMLVPIFFLSKQIAVLFNDAIVRFDAPQDLGGLLVALLVLSPKGLASFKATLENDFQRAMNIAFGTTIATAGLLIPASLVIGLATGQTVELGLNEVDTFLVLFTILVIIVDLIGKKTNILQGVVHLILFFTYVVLLFD